MDGKTGIMSKRRFMKLLLNSSILCLVLLLSGCASIDKFNSYVDAQKSFSRDETVIEIARISALVEISKNGDTATKVEAIRALSQQNKKTIVIEQPRGLLGN